MRVGVELFAEGTLDRTHVNEIIKRAGVSRTLFYHYFPSKTAFARAIVEHEILHFHGLVEQQIEPTLKGAISTFAGYVRYLNEVFYDLKYCYFNNPVFWDSRRLTYYPNVIF